MSDYEEKIEKMKLQKAHNNSISFSEIEKNHFKIRKDLSLPPISLSGAPSGPSTTKQAEGFQSEVSVQSHTTKNSPLKILRKDEMIEEIHNLRLKAYDLQERGKDREIIKLGVTKKERQDILSQYYNAKKQLSNVK
jgi:hypothetical protein